ncbi:DUF6560 family protein [Abyssisolibacter fermentans]|uniref:DUF6560 family protein n=1 Tax=Abyssisolibacter fermentans TaxID=1766203 RepID=UPI00082BF7E4|nr:DUF6560 family protein [Abyssisolibacter fermentans]
MGSLSYVLIAIIISFVFLIAKKENEEVIQNITGDSFIIRLPKVYIWIGAICALFFTVFFVLMLIFPNDTAEIWVGVVFITFILLGLFLVYTSIKWQVHVYKNYIIYRTVFGREYEFKYTEIKHVKLTQNSLKIKTDKKTFSIDSQAIGKELILQRFNENNVIVK